MMQLALSPHSLSAAPTPTQRTALPGAFSITNFFARNKEEVAIIQESGRKIAMDMLSMPGFISMASIACPNAGAESERADRGGLSRLR
jgi:hypothetical protein